MSRCLHHRDIEPAAPPLPLGGHANLPPRNLEVPPDLGPWRTVWDHAAAGAVGEFGGEGTPADASGVGLDDPHGALDLVGGEASGESGVGVGEGQ